MLHLARQGQRVDLLLESLAAQRRADAQPAEGLEGGHEVHPHAVLLQHARDHAPARLAHRLPRAQRQRQEAELGHEGVHDLPPHLLAAGVHGVRGAVEALPVEEHGDGGRAPAVEEGHVGPAADEGGDEPLADDLARVEGQVQRGGARHAHDVRVVGVEGDELLQAGADVAVRPRVGVHPGAAQLQHGVGLEVQRRGVDGLQPQGVLARRVHVLLEDPLQHSFVLLLPHRKKERQR